MAKMVTTPPSCLRPPPDPPPSSCLNAPRDALSPVIPPEPPDPPDVALFHVAATVHRLDCSSSRSAKEFRTVRFSFTPSHHCLGSYSAGNPCLRSVSHDVTRMNFRSVSSEVFDLHFQTISIKNTQFEHQASSLNLASRASIVVQDMDVEVSCWVEESTNFKLVSFQYTTNQSLEDWLLIVKVSGVTCFVDVQLLPMYLLCYARPDLVIEASQEAVSFSSTHWLLYLGNRLLLVTGSSIPNDHYSSLTVDILFLWSIIQHRHLYTARTESISCNISESKTCRITSISVIGVCDQLMILKDKKVLYIKNHLMLFRTSGSPSRLPSGVFLVISPSPLLHFMFTESRTVTTSIFVFGEMAFDVRPDEFSKIGVLDSTLSDQRKLMELSSFAVVLVSMVSPSSPNSLLFVALEIHLVSPESLFGVRVDLIRLVGCLAKSRSSSGIFALFQTSSFGYLNVDLDYDKLFRASAAGIQVKSAFGFLYFEQASPVNTSILGCIVSFMFIVASSILVVVVLSSSIAPVVTS